MTPVDFYDLRRFGVSVVYDTYRYTHRKFEIRRVYIRLFRFLSVPLIITY